MPQIPNGENAEELKRVKAHIFELYMRQRYQTPDPKTDHSIAVSIQNKADTSNRMLGGFSIEQNRDKNSVTMQFNNNDSRAMRRKVVHMELQGNDTLEGRKLLERCTGLVQQIGKD